MEPEKQETTGQEQDRNSDGTFKKGRSGNPNGRPRGMSWGDVVLSIGDEELGDSGITKKEYIVSVVYSKAHEGDINAIKLLWNSLVGTKNIINLSGKVDTGSEKIAELLLKLHDQTGISTDNKTGSSQPLQG